MTIHPSIVYVILNFPQSWLFRNFGALALQYVWVFIHLYIYPSMYVGVVIVGVSNCVLLVLFQEIASREAALRERERNIERLGTGERPNNFPPFPKFCPTPFKPCFYLNIKVEVPPSEQWKMYFLLALLIYLWVVLTLNVIIAVVGAITVDSNIRSTYLITMGVSILYWVLFVPGALFCWFLPVYYAYKKDSSLAFMWFFFVMLFQVLSFILNAIGAPNLGACGFFNGAAFFDSTDSSKVATGAMFMIMGFAWAVGAPIAVLLIFLVHRYYRISGSLNKAASEAVSGAAQNKYVRSTVKEGVKAGVSGALSSDK